jgi:hypothetical protein
MKWTLERIAALPIDQVKNLRDNAQTRGGTEIVGLCDADLARRKPPKAKKTKVDRKKDSIVRGFHFICPTEKEVVTNPDGTVWTGVWVVDKTHAERAVTHEAYVALHVAKAVPSYRQGIVRGWRPKERLSEYADDRPAKIKFGVEFLLEPTDKPFDWYGDATGEKGYFYGDKTDEVETPRLPSD